MRDFEKLRGKKVVDILDPPISDAELGRVSAATIALLLKCVNTEWSNTGIVPPNLLERTVIDPLRAYEAARGFNRTD